MIFLEKLIQLVEQGGSFLCVGLDPDVKMFPTGISKNCDGIVEFNREIIAATKDFTIAYKPNFAFYERWGVAGWKALEQTRRMIPADKIAIADAKRCDIGNTSKMYAQAILQELDFDAITVNPWMGEDSVEPFLENEEKGAYFLTVTSNSGSQDFQKQQSGDKIMYERVIENVQLWNRKQNAGIVVGATQPEELRKIRDFAPELPILIPGLGAQGGDLEASVSAAFSCDGAPPLFNQSRGILYADSGKDFAEVAHQTAQKTRNAINKAKEQ